MAASVQSLSLLRRGTHILLQIRLSGLNKSALNERRYATEESRNDVDLDEDIEKEIMAIRDVSRLTGNQKSIVRKEVPDLENKPSDYRQSVPYRYSLKFKKRMYAKFGKDSGLDPRMLWPSKSELMETVADDKEWETDFHKSLAEIKEKRNMEAEKMRQREEKVKQNMEKMDKWISEYKARETKIEETLATKRLRQKRLTEEAKEFFGYELNKQDPKYQEFIMEKEMEEKQAKKDKKKQENMSKKKDKLNL